MAEELSADLVLNIDEATQQLASVGDTVEQSLAQGAEAGASALVDSVSNAASSIEQAIAMAGDAGASALADSVSSVVGDITGTPVELQLELLNIDEVTGEITAVQAALDSESQLSLFDASATLSALDDVSSAAGAAGDALVGMGETGQGALDAISSGGADAADSLSGIGDDARGSTEGVSGLQAATIGLSTALAASKGEGREVAGGLREMIGVSGPAAAGILGVGAGLGAFFAEGVKAESAGTRVAHAFGDMAESIKELDVGGLSGNMNDLAQSVGTTEAQLDNGIAKLGEFGKTAGFSAEQTKTYTQEVTALALRATALQPSLGSVDQVIQRLSRGLAVGGRFAQMFYLNLARKDITEHAVEMFGTVAGELTQTQKAFAGADLAVSKLGDNLGKDFNNGIQSADNQLRALKASIENAFEKAASGGLVESIQAVLDGLLPIATAVLSVVAPAFTVLAGALELVAPLLPEIVAGFVAMKVAELAAAGITLLGGALMSLGGAMESIGLGATAQAVGALGASAEGAGLGLSRMVTPLAIGAAGALLAAQNFDQMGVSTSGTIQGMLGMAAAGGSLGFVLAGPPGAAVGAFAGLVAGATVALLSGGESVEKYRQHFADLAPAIDKASSSAKVADLFLSKLGSGDIIDFLGKTKGAVSGVADEIEALASKSPDAAQKVIKSLRQMGEDGKLAFEPGSAAAKKFNADLDELSTKVTETAKKQAVASGEAAAANQVITDTANAAADAQRAKMLASQDAVFASAAEAAQSKAAADIQTQTVQIALQLAAAQHSTAEATRGAALAYNEGATAASNYKTAIDVLNASTLDVYSAQAGAEASVQSFNKSLWENGQTLDLTTEKGNQNAQALVGLVRSFEGLATAQQQVDKTGKTSAETMIRLKDTLIGIRDNLPDEGDKRQVQGLIDSLEGFAKIPPPPPVPVTVDTSKVSPAMADAQKQLLLFDLERAQATADVDTTPVNPKIQAAVDLLAAWNIAHGVGTADADNTPVTPKIQAAIDLLETWNKAHGTGTADLNNSDVDPKVAYAKSVLDYWNTQHGTGTADADNSDVDPKLAHAHNVLDAWNVAVGTGLVDADNTEVPPAVSAAAHLLDDYDKKHVTAHVHVGGADAAASDIQSVENKLRNLDGDAAYANVYVTTHERTVVEKAGGGYVYRAAGGLVPGTGESDTVPAMLTPGEFVLSKQMLSGSVPVPSAIATTLFGGVNRFSAVGQQFAYAMAAGMASGSDAVMAAGVALTQAAAYGVANAGSPSDHLFYDRAVTQAAAYIEAITGAAPDARLAGADLIAAVTDAMNIAIADGSTNLAAAGGTLVQILNQGVNQAALNDVGTSGWDLAVQKALDDAAGFTELVQAKLAQDIKDAAAFTALVDAKLAGFVASGVLDAAAADKAAREAPPAPPAPTTAAGAVEPTTGSAVGGSSTVEMAQLTAAIWKEVASLDATSKVLTDGFGAMVAALTAPKAPLEIALNLKFDPGTGTLSASPGPSTGAVQVSSVVATIGAL